ncbi:MAG: hypothetical protein JNM10_06185 [Planctomycetia bacterium]|nr:hypothetical protein [Planctomycetia bacterium]
MILHAASLLALFVGLVELALGGAVVALAVRALRRRRRDAAAVDAGLPLVGHLATVLTAVAVVGWPLLYLLLDAYVPQWRGVVCIQGVTRIGEGSVGPARLLPPLLVVLQATKPALVLAVGAWAVLRAANRATATGALAGRELAALVACGALAVVDAVLTGAYVWIPKREQFLESGCCAVPPRGTTQLVDGEFTTRTAAAFDGRVLSLAYVAVTLALVLATTWALRRPRWTWGALLAAALAVPVGLVFLREVAAPRFLGLPGHRCAYCILSSSAAGVAFLALAATGVLCVAWAAVAHALGRDPAAPEDGPSARATRLLRAGRLATVAAAAIVGVQWLP